LHPRQKGLGRPKDNHAHSTCIFPTIPWKICGISSVHSAFCCRRHPLPAHNRGKSFLHRVGTLKVTTEVVNVYAVVREKNGHLISNLNKEDFLLEEDQQAQEIRYFSREADTPLTMGILVDTSPSQGRVLEEEKSEAEAFLREVMRPKDLTFVLHFDVEVELLAGLHRGSPSDRQGHRRI